MKKWLGLVLFGLLLGFTACNDDDDNSPKWSAAEIEQVMQQGDWQITRFTNSGLDETSSFEGFAFEFKTNGTVVATRGDEVINGIWFIDTDDDDLDDQDFELVFPSFGNFSELSEDWEVLTLNSGKIELGDDDSSDDDNDDDSNNDDFLTFEKLN